MEVRELSLKGAKLIKPQIFYDDRGFFFESHRQSFYETFGIDCSFVQDNHSYSKRGVIRGMHYQITPGQDKLIRVVQGEIFDVIVDIRPDSPTFLKWEGVCLDDQNYEQLFIPKGFAHGFQVMSEVAQVLYKVSTPYDAKTERTFSFNDPEIGIEWPLEPTVISERDLKAPAFNTEVKI